MNLPCISLGHAHVHHGLIVRRGQEHARLVTRHRGVRRDQDVAITGDDLDTVQPERRHVDEQRPSRTSARPGTPPARPHLGRGRRYRSLRLPVCAFCDGRAGVSSSRRLGATRRRHTDPINPGSAEPTRTISAFTTISAGSTTRAGRRCLRNAREPAARLASAIDADPPVLSAWRALRRSRSAWSFFFAERSSEKAWIAAPSATTSSGFTFEVRRLAEKRLDRFAPRAACASRRRPG